MLENLYICLNICKKKNKTKKNRSVLIFEFIVLQILIILIFKLLNLHNSWDCKKNDLQNIHITRTLKDTFSCKKKITRNKQYSFSQEHCHNWKKNLQEKGSIIYQENIARFRSVLTDTDSYTPPPWNGNYIKFEKHSLNFYLPQTRIIFFIKKSLM